MVERDGHPPSYLPGVWGRDGGTDPEANWLEPSHLDRAPGHVRRGIVAEQPADDDRADSDYVAKAGRGNERRDDQTQRRLSVPVLSLAQDFDAELG